MSEAAKVNPKPQISVANWNMEDFDLEILEKCQQTNMYKWGNTQTPKSPEPQNEQKKVA